MFDDSAFTALAALSREFYLACDPDGIILYADDRARRIVGARPGDSLRTLVAPGCEHKLEQFLRRGCAAGVDSCELPFIVCGRPLATSLSSTPCRTPVSGLLLIGHVMPEGFAATINQISTMISEVVDLNREVLTQRNEIAERHADQMRVNAELSESHLGVLALHRELREKADEAQHEHEVKTRLVLHLSHELRTPIHSIIGLTRLLTTGGDGALSSEQEKQARFIRTSADDLLALVNDVLDLGRLEAGHARIRLERFGLEDFLASMRGALRPLVPTGAAVELVIDAATERVHIETDRTMLSQIVRNLVSNALKFTERGEVRVRVAVQAHCLQINVSDTGIGIRDADLDTIFVEYGQVDSPAQQRSKGTGLGLPLSRRLAERLGGTLRVESKVSSGSTFILTIPTHHDEARAMEMMLERSRHKAADAASILVVEDDWETLVVYEQYLVAAGFHVMPARSIEEAEALLRANRPAAIVLDVLLGSDTSWSFLAALKKNMKTRDIPVLVVTVTNQEAKARALGADGFWLKPVDQDRMLRMLKKIALPTPPVGILIIDDDEAARYILRRHLEETSYVLFEASTAEQGIDIARAQQPSVIFLDLLLNGPTAFDVMDALKADPRTSAIPVIVLTSHELDAVEQRRLEVAVISKRELSREVALDRIREALRHVGSGPERERRMSG